jgi:hypothetical protein
MDVVTQIVLPVFGVVALGYAATFTAVFDEAAQRGLAAFVFTFALPVALFRTMAGADLPEVVPLGFLAAYYAGTALMFMPVMLLARGPGDRRTLMGFGAAYSNSVLLGIPLVTTALGPAASVPLLLLIALHNPLFFTLVTVLIEIARGSRSRLRRFPLDLARALIGNLILVAVVLGLACNVAGLALPGPVDRSAAYLAQAALPAALFSMGASLRRYRVVGALTGALGIVAAKLVLHPLVMAALVLLLLDLPPLWAQVAILTAGLPTGINVYLFAARYRVAEAESATAILLSNLASVATLSLVLLALGVDPGVSARGTP